MRLHNTSSKPANAKDFNPRTREGCDDDEPGYIESVVIISIHAPVKGATEALGAELDALRNFNPRTREGCD